jgi:hypothetical protein
MMEFSSDSDLMQALHTMIEEAKQSGEEFSIAELARNGSLITETIIRMGGYQSISGNYIRSIFLFSIS